ncbi:uncharacterized protein BO97DRAFT_378465 [Aspergillus homomorphus CBS 101889]|uniref:Uncharacterized protein n=1 Tax=Aspergillus homomorphus (strain CBS 101889) TaxID=1450537 RepID=A0A395HI55_ASPHC|nr:hypothetical protein BO97DRAFT_378465 [Aspergillus homomorphus CBS 101889]RAL07487.1 hypothetical protein BO97DRAFT_378465 [Aspergillus homomorphus CBS 101889]
MESSSTEADSILSRQQAEVQSHAECHENILTESFSVGNMSGHGWKELQDKYVDLMEQHKKAEDALRNHTSRLLEVFMAWSQTTIMRDEKRALRRFKTQMQHVQNSEETLKKKKKHYTDVVKAFESALALLDDRV